ncbi:transcriptional regulator [Ahniella affigens]|uniref:Transcriptional regulator n=1 Tax=Ahniella affigens TaxID=2021234 RepID=A0A2P1PNP9_9GAMM|nr:AlpA family phage regulatory protein [Ahniella affigens]AVP96446.1 transcriptional regulator [Ahniella affigens]
MQLSTQLPETGFVRLPTVLQVIPVSRSHWWAGVRDGRFPKGVKLSDRCTAWKVEDIRALIGRIAREAASGDNTPNPSMPIRNAG